MSTSRKGSGPRDHPARTNSRGFALSAEQWERHAEWPLAGVALAFLIAFAWPILDPGESPAVKALCDVVQFGAWVIFLIDYGARLLLSKNRGAFVRSHVIDLAVVVLPLLRPLRLLRLITVLSALNQGASRGLRGRVAVYVVGATTLAVFVGGLAMLDIERGQPEANIETPGDAWWWAIATVTTVGYGDRYPVTTSGRVVAVALMICGIALIGVVTASFASWLIERIRDEQSEARDDVAELLEEIRKLRTGVARSEALGGVHHQQYESESRRDARFEVSDDR